MEQTQHTKVDKMFDCMQETIKILMARVKVYDAQAQALLDKKSPPYDKLRKLQRRIDKLVAAKGVLVGEMKRMKVDEKPQLIEIVK